MGQYKDFIRALQPNDNSKTIEKNVCCFTSPQVTVCKFFFVFCFFVFLFWRVPIIIQLSKLNPGNKFNPGSEHVFHSHKSIEFPMIHVHVQV